MGLHGSKLSIQEGRPTTFGLDAGVENLPRSRWVRGACQIPSCRLNVASLKGGQRECIGVLKGPSWNQRAASTLRFPLKPHPTMRNVDNVEFSVAVIMIIRKPDTRFYAGLGCPAQCWSQRPPHTVIYKWIGIKTLRLRKHIGCDSPDQSTSSIRLKQLFVWFSGKDSNSGGSDCPAN